MTHSELSVQIFCRSPVVGEVKTRLIPRLGAVGAYRLYTAMLNRLVANLGIASGACELWISGANAPGIEEIALPRYPQNGVGIGERMKFALVSGLSRSSRVVLVGVDLPLIDAVYVERAMLALNEHDVVLGPAEDGGYGLVGIKGTVPDIFSDIDWGTDRVLSQTCAILNKACTSYALLPLIWDVDRPEDLPRYEAWLKQHPA